MPHRNLTLSGTETDLPDGRRVLVWALPPGGAATSCTFIGGLLDGETLEIPAGATYVRAAEPGGGSFAQYVPADGALWRQYVEPRDDRVLEG